MKIGVIDTGLIGITTAYAMTQDDQLQGRVPALDLTPLASIRLLC